MRRSSIVDHLISWGFVHALGQQLLRAVRGGYLGTPMLCVIRLLRQMASDRADIIDNLATGKVDIIDVLTQCLKRG
jgi:hypothetical protein